MNNKSTKKKGVTVDDLAVTVNNLTATVNDLAMTIEELVQMTQRGFEDIIAKMATKADVNKRFDVIDTRLDRIEYLLVGGLSNRLEMLEDKMRIVQTSLARKK
ncbi:MAG: hypothetical protein HZC04_01445 [Candidatus Lloydbacteria bacterium]|nr:hypothetical protein [Candidatus Lloydbacteria bacterium]